MEALAQGFEVNCLLSQQEKTTLLHQLVIDGLTTTYVLEVLIQNGANLFAVDHQGWTPLHYAALHNRVTYARILVMRGADQKMEMKGCPSPISIAKSHKSDQVLKYFNKEIKDEDLVGLQEQDLEYLQQVKRSTSDNLRLIQARMEELRNSLSQISNEQEALEIVKQIRFVKLTVCSE